MILIPLGGSEPSALVCPRLGEGAPRVWFGVFEGKPKQAQKKSTHRVLFNNFRIVDISKFLASHSGKVSHHLFPEDKNFNLAETNNNW